MDTEEVAPILTSPDGRSNGSLLHLASPLSVSPGSRMELVQGQKRTATGEIKSTVFNGAQRGNTPDGALRHSRTLSAGSSGSRIAELSAQLRARLSYAAAKVEKGWRPRSGDAVRTTPSTSSPSTSQNIKNDTIFPRAVRPENIGCLQLDHGNTLISTPALGGPCNLRLLDSKLKPSFTSIRLSSPLEPASSLSGSSVSESPLRNTQIPPKLAPPADIVSTSENGGSRRRCPTMNGTSPALTRSSYLRHRRHYSEQEIHMSSNHTRSNTPFIPGTPPLRLSQPAHSGQTLTSSITNRPASICTPSQNASTEQDAIEGLLTMRSPENSGYRPSSQPRPMKLNTNFETQMGLNLDNVGTGTQSSLSSDPRTPRKVEFVAETSSGHHTPSFFAVPVRPLIGLEALAGDEIDRILDQIGDSDSDGELDLVSYGLA